MCQLVRGVREFIWRDIIRAVSKRGCNGKIATTGAQRVAIDQQVSGLVLMCRES